MPQVLVLNPGSTSTKTAVFTNGSCTAQETLRHDNETLAAFPTLLSQLPFRLKSVIDFLDAHKLALESMDGTIAIGGMLRPGGAGVYAVCDALAEDLASGKYTVHASNLGGLMAKDLAGRVGKTGYLADPVTSDELAPVARLSGHPKFPRLGRAHTLNHKAVAMREAENMGKRYEECRFIVAHLGGGVSVAAHADGRMVDTNNARGEGPFSIDRSGGINSWELARFCLSGKAAPEEILEMISGAGGMVAYLGSRSLIEVEQRADAGEELARSVYESFVYQVAKEIGAMSAVLEGKADAVLLTGGMANSKRLTAALEKRVGYIAPVRVHPGEREMDALAAYMEKVLAGSLTPQRYDAGR